MRLFDAYVVIDWSAAATPKRGRDSIWCAAIGAAAATDPAGDGRGGPAGAVDLVNLPTRHEAERWLFGRFEQWRGLRVLAGFDFSFGYPAGLAAGLGTVLPDGRPWEATWKYLAAHVADDERNGNDRFRVATELNRKLGPEPGPFWGCPASAASPDLATTKPLAGSNAAGIGAYRFTERTMRAAGHRVFSGWQLLGAGSVGSQSLTGIPVLQRLRDRPALADRVCVWPFESAAMADSAPDPASAVVFAEVWPGCIALDESIHLVRDAAQVVGLSRHLAALDRDGDLAALFTLDLPPTLREIVTAEEGWILGCPMPHG